MFFFRHQPNPNNAPQVFQPDSQILNTATDNSKVVINKTPALPYDNTVCQSSTNSYGCFVDFYKTLTKDKGATVAIDDIKQRSAKNPSVLSDCHPLMHVIGREAANAYTQTSDAFLHGDAFCWSGYYHGIMEGMVLKMGKANLFSQLNNICSDIPGKANYSFDYFNCVHGLGHGIMALSDDEVFDSLKSCDILTGDWEKQSCYGGVYMQNIIDSTNVADTDNVVKYLKPSEPLYPCTAVDAKYKGQCYLSQTSYALQVTGYDYKKVFDLCATVENPYRAICNQSMGRDVANQARHEAEKTKAMCNITTNADDVSNCVIGAVKEIISYYHSDKEALAYCNILDGEDKTICTDTAHSYYRQF